MSGLYLWFYNKVIFRGEIPLCAYMICIHHSLVLIEILPVNEARHLVVVISH